MKDNNVVDLTPGLRRQGNLPVTDFWFAQVDIRLTRIEKVIKRLEMQLVVIVSGIALTVVMSLVEILAQMR